MSEDGEEEQGGDPFLGPRIRLIMKLRSGGIHDTAVLSAIEGVPRHLFVPRIFEAKAYEDTTLPIEAGQMISQPWMVATMASALSLNNRHRVLEVGTGSGYQGAILARLARRVYTIERHRDLLQLAEERFNRLGIENITAKTGDGSKGWPEAAPFDRIVVTAATEDIPELLLGQLTIGGVMVLPVGDPTGEQDLIRVEKTDVGISEQQLMTVRFAPLIEGKVQS